MTLQHLFVSASTQSHSTPDLVAQTLREAIIAGLYEAGQPLRQDEIAAQLGVSKIPVREALRRLEAEGLVVFYTNRGAVVAPLVAAEVQEIAEIRVALETLALRLAIPNIGTRDLRRAQDLLDDLDHEADIARWGTLNREFHATLYVPAQRPQLLALVTTQHLRFDRYLRVVLASMQHQQQSQEEHRALVAACAQHDTSTATMVLQQHIEMAAQLLVEHLQQHSLAQSKGI